MSELPLVSIICPSYNTSEFIGETINSVLNQSYKNIELIVVDDGSTDGSLEYLRTLKSRIILAESNHGGASKARNYGASISNGDFLLFLDSDDLLGDNVIELLLQRAVDLGEGFIVGSSWRRLIYSDNTWMTAPSELDDSPPGNDFIKGWLSGWYIPPGGILWHKIDFKTIGGWDESLSANQDGDLILRALLAGIKLSIVKGTNVYYRFHGADKASISNLRSIDKLKSRIKVLGKVRDLLKQKGDIEKYTTDIGRAYHNLARNHYHISNELAEYCNKEAISLAGSKSINGTFIHTMFTKVFGLKLKERIAHRFSSVGIKKTKRNLSELIMNRLDEK